MLTEKQLAAWEDYLRAEGRDTRVNKLLALESFLATIAASPHFEWFPWARDLAERIVDNREEFVLRRPLFERAVFPALLAGMHAGRPGCARWLAGLSQHLIGREDECSKQLPPDLRTERGLLRAASDQDPTDQLSRRQLIHSLAGRLNHSLHEIPAGVLYGMDGATVEQCRELEQELSEFCRLVSEEKLEQLYDELIDGCRLHFPAYREYLIGNHKYADYKDFLQHHRSYEDHQC